MAFQQNVCGCWYFNPKTRVAETLRQANLNVHSKILATASETSLRQTFVNPSPDKVEEVSYQFPLADGISIVSFKCEIGDRVIHGIVKEKSQAREDYKAAVSHGQHAALLESYRTSDTFTTKIGNVPAESTVVVHVTYVSELQHDAQADGVRFTLPMTICPRYGSPRSGTWDISGPSQLAVGGIDITVDVRADEKSLIKRLYSPSHPLDVHLGRLSTYPEEDHQANRASATWRYRSTQTTSEVSLVKDFILVINIQGHGEPFALLESHPTIPGQRAIMTSLVPKFDITSNETEIVFVLDRSGSMGGKIATLISAMKVFLKSLPVGVKFNFCSFGSSYSFLWEKSRTYDGSSQQEAMDYIQSLDANFGGTEMLAPVRATVENRFQDLELDVLLLTDGEIWGQSELFDYIKEAVAKNPVRVFSLGIGDVVSHALVEGVARAGKGFAQFVSSNEELDRKVVRMLKGALTPHVKYTLEVEYGENGGVDDDFEMVEKVADDSASPPEEAMDVEEAPQSQPQPISLFDKNFSETENKPIKYSIPQPLIPSVLQGPHEVPSLFSFNRTSVYLLLSPNVSDRPQAVILKGKSKQGPLSLKIPIEDIGEAVTIHQLAARKIAVDLEDGQGWIHHAKDSSGKLFLRQHWSREEDIVKAEAVRLGTKFQVSNKWCAFVAVEGAEQNLTMMDAKEEGTFMKESLYKSSVFSSAACSRHSSSGAYRHPNHNARFGGQGASLYRSASTNVNTPVLQCMLTSFGATRNASAGLFSASEEVLESTPQSEFDRIISCQTFEGPWEWNEQNLSTFGSCAEDLEKKVDWSAILGLDKAAIDKHDPELRKIMATLLAVAILNKRWASRKESFELLVEKAISWVKTKLDARGAQFSGSQQDITSHFGRII